MQRFHFHSEWLNHFTRIVPILTQCLFCFAIQITSKHEQREPLWQFMRGNAATMVCFALFRVEIGANRDQEGCISARKEVLIQKQIEVFSEQTAPNQGVL